MLRDSSNKGLPMPGLVILETNSLSQEARKGVYLAREELVRTLSSPSHKSVKQRWQLNAQNYRNTCKPLKVLLDSVATTG